MATAIWAMSFPTGRATGAACAIASIRPSLRFVHRDDMEAEGYGDYLDQVEDVA
jgi:peptide-methionine (R)-S-oxide reductase